MPSGRARPRAGCRRARPSAPSLARAAAAHAASAAQSPSAAPSSTSVSRASPTTAWAPCLTASNRAAFTVTMPHAGCEAGPRRGGEVLQSGADRQDHVRLGGQVVRRRGADDARARPPYSGWSCGTSVRPATVSTTGTPCCLGEGERLRAGTGVADAAAEDQQRAPAERSSSRPRRQVLRSGRGRGTRCTRGSNMATGKSYSSACTSCGSASTTGPQSAGSVSTRATCGSVAISCSGRVIRSK